MGEYHRIRFYQGRWLNFDAIEPCKNPAPCIGCSFGHPRCDEEGRTLPAPPVARGDEGTEVSRG